MEEDRASRSEPGEQEKERERKREDGGGKGEMKGMKRQGRIIGMRGTGRRAGSQEVEGENEKKRDQRRTTKVIKLERMAGSDRLVGHSIGNSTNLWTS